ncbi:hypothetical protein [Zunongwangia sp. H14]|uniref:hypothetical protein n=1 Tax=Zunongwangia sp. H14 TaxID=3240792 RepID=UPI00356538D3
MLALLYSLSSHADTVVIPLNSVDLDSRDYSYLQGDQNRQAVFLEELSAEPASSIIEDLLAGTAYLQEGFQYKLLSEETSADYDSWVYLLNLKNLLELQIFPFNFFW